MAYLGNSTSLYDPTRSTPTKPDVFSGNGSQLTFNLSRGVGSSSDIIVIVENVIQQPDYAYFASGNSLTFTSAPGAGTNNIYVVYEKVTGLTGTVPDGSITASKLANNIRLIATDQYVGTGSQTTFNLSDTPYDANSLIVTVNGITQSPPVNYTVSSNTIVFTSAPSSGANVIIKNIGFRTTQTLYALAANTPIVQPVITGGSANNISITNSLFSGSANLINGVLQVPLGNTAQRPSTPNIGYVRYNTDIGALENYTAQGWFKVSVQSPIISNISGYIYNGNTSTLTITGQNFGTSAANVTFTGANTASVTGITPAIGGTSLSVNVPSAIYTIAAGSSVGVTITNSDGATSGGYSMPVVGLPTGGNTLSQTGNTRIHTFTSSGTFTVPTGFIATASYLVVAGGGGGGPGYQAGGGGAGGFLSGTTSISAGSFTVTVGSGGGGGSPINSADSTKGSPGSTSSFYSTSPSMNLSVIGGGGGASYWNPDASGRPGGSGGGAGCKGPAAPFSGGSGTPGQGNAGGDFPGNYNSPYSGGGGGGAGSTGSIGGSNTGNGGVGLSSNITGSPVYYGGGGGAGSYYGPNSTGGNGGGGGGSTTQGSNGTTNTGGGGGGSGSTSTAGASGGSGIVIVSYTI